MEGDVGRNWEEQGGETVNKTQDEGKKSIFNKKRERQNELNIRNWKFSEKLVSLSGKLFR